MLSKLSRLVAIAALVCVFGQACTTTPKGSAPVTQAPIYDTKADGYVQLNNALLRARREHKRVLADLGANWCGDSQAMFRLLQSDSVIKQEVAKHYVLVMIDVNERDGPPRNRSVVERLESPLSRGIPVLLILDSSGNVLNKDPQERLSDSAHKTPEVVLNYLKKWSMQNR